MLTARGELRIHAARMRLLACFERTFRVHVVARRGLLYDSRFAVPSVRADDVHLYLFVAGEVEVDGARLTTPVALAAHGREIELGRAGSAALRSWGAPLLLVDVRLAPTDVRAPVGVARGPRALSPTSWAAAAALATACDEARPADGKVAALLAALEADGVVGGQPRASIRLDEPPAFRRLSASLVPSITSLEVSLAAKTLPDAIGVSLRQLLRDTSALTQTFAMIGRGYRDTLRRLRLRTAIILLSAPGATVGDVAAHTGYGSLHAMARAFRDADLPAPRDVQAAVRCPA